VALMFHSASSFIHSFISAVITAFCAVKTHHTTTTAAHYLPPHTATHTFPTHTHLLRHYACAFALPAPHRFWRFAPTILFLFAAKRHALRRMASSIVASSLRRARIRRTYHGSGDIGSVT